MLKDNKFALLAGICAAGGSFFGKLSGNIALSDNVYLSLLCLGTMIIMNAVMWTFFSKALSTSSTSVGPTVASAATNYLTSGVLGVVVFGEATSLLWWSGTSLVLIGLVLLSKGTKEHQHVS